LPSCFTNSVSRPGDSPSSITSSAGPITKRRRPSAGPLIGIIQILDDEGATHASLGFRADGHLLLEPGRLLDDPPGLLLKLMLGSLWQDQAKGEHERPPH